MTDVQRPLTYSRPLKPIIAPLVGICFWGITIQSSWATNIRDLRQKALQVGATFQKGTEAIHARFKPLAEALVPVLKSFGNPSQRRLRQIQESVLEEVSKMTVRQQGNALKCLAESLPEKDAIATGRDAWKPFEIAVQTVNSVANANFWAIRHLRRNNPQERQKVNQQTEEGFKQVGVILDILKNQNRIADHYAQDILFPGAVMLHEWPEYVAKIRSMLTDHPEHDASEQWQWFYDSAMQRLRGPLQHPLAFVDAITAIRDGLVTDKVDEGKFTGVAIENALNSLVAASDNVTRDDYVMKMAEARADAYDTLAKSSD